MVVILFGSTTRSSPLQPEKAEEPMRVTLSGMVTLVICVEQGLAAILRFLFGLLPMDSGTEAVVVEQQAGGGDMPPMEAEDPFILWVILEYVAMIALLIVWVGFLVLTLLYSTEAGKTCFDLIEQSEILTFLYEKNLLLAKLLSFQ